MYAPYILGCLGVVFLVLGAARRLQETGVVGVPPSAPRLVIGAVFVMRGRAFGWPAPPGTAKLHKPEGVCGRETGSMTETPTIPGYRIESRLGQGGMATVYLAIQQSFEREVALKVMSPMLNSDPSFAERFKREARIVAQLNHASIVPVFDVGEHQFYHYLSMEYLPAGDLKSRILDGERDPDLALRVCMALSAALEIAHRKGYVHRDIKPENILFREDGTPVLTDFGIARALDSGRSMTLAGMLVGTPDYMSPEQVKGLELDGRSDLYSVGIVFYEILTGSVPFKADSSLSVALKQVGEPLPPLPPEYAEYQEFLDCLTAKDREERFASGAEVVRALRLISSGRGMDRARLRTLTPTQGLSGSSTTGTPLPVNPTLAPAETYVSQPTLARPRVTGAKRGLGSALTNPPEAAAADRGDTASPPNATAPGLGEVAGPRQHPTLIEGGGEGQGSSSAADPKYAEQESTVVSKQPSRVEPDGAVTAQPGVTLEADGAVGSHGSSLSEPQSATRQLQHEAATATGSAIGRESDTPRMSEQLPAGASASVTASDPGVQSDAAAPVNAGGLPSDPRTNSVHKQPLWFAAAAVAAVAICVGLVFIARPDKGARVSVSTQSQLNIQPAAPAGNPGAQTAQATPAQPPGPSALQNASAEQTAAAQTSTAAPGVESDQSQSAKAASLTRAEARAEAKARRNRAWEEYLQRKAERKAEKERLAAEARAAELAAQEPQIQGLLAAAKTQYAAGALWQPAGSSAADSYRAILTMQPQRPEALAGVQRLANVLADEAEDAEASGNLDSSKQLIDQVQSLQPTHPKLPELQARFQQLQSSPAALDARDRGRLDKAAKYIARAEEDLGHKPLNSRAVDDAIDQYDKALSTAPKAPGLPSLKERLVAAYASVIQTALDLHDTKRAQKLISNAHKRNWSSPELDQLEATLPGGSAPDPGIKAAGAH